MYTEMNVTRSYVYNVARALDNGNRVPKVGWFGALYRQKIYEGHLRKVLPQCCLDYKMNICFTI